MASPHAPRTIEPFPARTALWLRIGLSAAALAVAAGSAAGYLRWQGNHDRLVELLEKTGVAERSAGALSQLAWERATEEATLSAARSLVYDVLAAPEDAPANGAARLEQLAQARLLAREVLARQPASWQGWLLDGAATYVEQAQRRDRRLYTEAAAWEQPLLRAHALAPGKSEPKRFLAAAYLEVWPALSASKKELAGSLIAEIFAREPRTFTRLLPAWLAVARGEEVFEPIPDRVETWRQLVDQLAHRRDWRRLLVARERYLAALDREIAQLIADGRRGLGESDRREGRTRLLQAIATAPTEARFVPRIVEALASYPPGMHDFTDAAALRRWVDWATALRVVGQSPFEPAMIERLAAAIGDPPPPAPDTVPPSPRRVWPRAQWLQHRQGWWLELRPETTARRLTIELAQAAAEGAVVAWQWDGAEVAAGSVKPGRGVVLELEITPEPHLLAMVPIAGGAAVPGEVRLEPAQPTRR